MIKINLRQLLFHVYSDRLVSIYKYFNYFYSTLIYFLSQKFTSYLDRILDKLLAALIHS